MSHPRTVFARATLARRRDPWAGAGIEPSLAEVLADPLIHLIMRRDGVTPPELRAVVDAAKARLGAGRCCRCAA